ncbi:MAG: heavy metal translocating P-type ATPase metal-binding domain-containing protein [Azonexus sp.]
MSDNGSCDLCGLPVGMQDFSLKTADRTFRFCCEGCKGIYQMLNDIDDTPNPPANNLSQGEAR